MYENEDQPQERKILRAKIQIGSVKGPLTYKPQQTVFHHDDISVEKRNRKNEIKAFVSPNLLSAERGDWDISNHVEKKLYVKKHGENFARDRSNPYIYNYRAEVLPPKNIPPIEKPSKFQVTTQLESQVKEILDIRQEDPINRGIFPRMTEMPIHPKLADAKLWNYSTEILKEDRIANFNKINTQAMENSQKKIPELVKPDYVSPVGLTERLKEEVRRQKKLGIFTTDKPVYMPPEEPVDRKSLKNRYAIEASRKYKTTKHSGCWEYNTTFGQYMWSDTGSFVYDSPGDIVIVHNPDAYIMEGPTLSATTHNFPRRIKQIVQNSTSSDQRRTASSS